MLIIVKQLTAIAIDFENTVISSFKIILIMNDNNNVIHCKTNDPAKTLLRIWKKLKLSLFTIGEDIFFRAPILPMPIIKAYPPIQKPNMFGNKSRVIFIISSKSANVFSNLK